MNFTSVSYGAATVVTGIITGLGAAFGVSLKTIVDVSPSPSDLLKSNEVDADSRLFNACVSFARERNWLKGGVYAHVETEIPPSRGMKSSSSVSLALLSALAKMGNITMESASLPMLSAEISRKAGVSVTGAFDDAYACYAGGMIFAENTRMRLLERRHFGNGMKVLFAVPQRRIEKKELPLQDMAEIEHELKLAFRLALDGMYREASLCNTMLISRYLDIDVSPVIGVLEAGASLGGISGTGPALYAVCREESVPAVEKALSDTGRIIKCEVRNDDEIVC
ncbi:MAG: shikimate kinase [Methanomassiliicoccales archaeon]